MFMACHALVFDLDDTLIHSTRAYGVANAAALDVIGLRDEGVSLESSRAEVKERLPPLHVSARNRWLYFKRLLENNELYSAKLLVQVMSVYEESLLGHLRQQWRDLRRGELLQKLAKRAPMAIVTNENLRSQVLKLNALDGVDALFHVMVTSEEFGVEKPNPALLRCALARLKVAPSDTLVVGDSFDDDIKPALDAGCRAVLSTEFAPRPVAFSAGCQTVSSLEEILKYDF